MIKKKFSDKGRGRSDRNRGKDSARPDSRSRTDDSSRPGEERPARFSKERNEYKTDKPSRSERSDKSARPKTSDKPSRFKKSDRAERPEKSDRYKKTDKPKRTFSPREGDDKREGRGDRAYSSERSSSSDKPSRFKKSDRAERPEKSDRYEKSERPTRTYTPRDGDDRREGRFERKPKKAKPSRVARPTGDGEFFKEQKMKDRRVASGKSAKPRGDRKFRERPKPNFSKHREVDEKETRPVISDVVTETRLNKFIANAGICSRREADDLITAGLVTVNGKVVTQMGIKVSSRDQIRFHDRIISGEKKQYLVLNKPKDYITTMDDPQERRTVMALIEGACKERVYPVGRLDRQTTGILIFTNDGDLAKKLTHPSHNIRKIYHVELNQALKKIDFDKIVDGIELEDGRAQVDEIGYAGEGRDKSQLIVTIHLGRNRIVRRIFESLGYSVTRLDRISFAGITKKELMRGKWRFLSEKEVGYLLMQSGSK